MTVSHPRRMTKRTKHMMVVIIQGVSFIDTKKGSEVVLVIVAAKDMLIVQWMLVMQEMMKNIMNMQSYIEHETYTVTADIYQH